MRFFISTKLFIKRLRSAAHPDPARDWFTLLTCSVVVLVGIIVWNAWAFDTIASGGTIGRVATTTPAVFSRSSLDTIHTIFANRAAEEAKYVTGVYRYADPSQ